MLIDTKRKTGTGETGRNIHTFRGLHRQRDQVRPLKSIFHQCQLYRSQNTKDRSRRLDVDHNASIANSPCHVFRFFVRMLITDRMFVELTSSRQVGTNHSKTTKRRTIGFSWGLWRFLKIDLTPHRWSRSTGWLRQMFWPGQCSYCYSSHHWNTGQKYFGQSVINPLGRPGEGKTYISSGDVELIPIGR